MNQYIRDVKAQLARYDIRCGGDGEFPVLELLWQCYLDANPCDDGTLREKESALGTIHAELSVEASDLLNGLVCDLCTAGQRAAFLEGIQIGFHLNADLSADASA